LTLLLALVPGPNFVGYWFVYRAYSHGVILRGARRALGTSIAIEWLPCAGLIAEQPPAQVERLSTAATRHEGRSFETVLSQILGTPPPRVEAGAWGLQAAPPAPTAVSEAPSAPPGLGRRLVASIPNLLTASRLVLAILFPWVDPRLWLPLFLAAAVTEFLDGALSRWLHAITWTGQLLDPIADKLFVLAVLVTLWSAGVLAGWMILLIAARDLLVLIGSLWVLAWGGPGSLRRMPPRWPGKVATAAQFLLLLLTITQKTVNPWALYPTAGLSLFAGLDYLRRFR
jgi:phosphatidylglycerophosphate synthase